MALLGESTSYDTLGQLLMSIIPGQAGLSVNVPGTADQLQANDLFSKQHVMSIGHSSMDPQRDWMYMLYINDVKGRYWNDVGLNYANFAMELLNNGYGILSGGISLHLIKGFASLVSQRGKVGTTSAQQELMYRCNNVQIPTRNVESVVGNFMGVKANFPTNITYSGELSATFEEGEDANILRQFNSWMNVMDEWAVASDLSSQSASLNDSTSAMLSVLANTAGNSKGIEHSLAHAMKTDIDLFMFRYSGEDIGYKIRYYGCYPTSIGGANWNYNSGASITYSVNFAYDYFKVEYIKSPLKPTVYKWKASIASVIDTLLQTVGNELFFLLFRAIARKATEQRMKNSSSRPTERDLTKPINTANQVLPGEPYEKIIREDHNANISPEGVPEGLLEKIEKALSKSSKSMSDFNAEVNPDAPIITTESLEQFSAEISRGRRQPQVSSNGLPNTEAEVIKTNKVYTSRPRTAVNESNEVETGSKDPLKEIKTNKVYTSRPRAAVNESNDIELGSRDSETSLEKLINLIRPTSKRVKVNVVNGVNPDDENILVNTPNIVKKDDPNSVVNTPNYINPSE